MSIFDLFKKQPDPKEIDTRLNAASLDLDACVYIAADNGKDTLVNRHLQRRADHLANHAEKMRNRLNKKPAKKRRGR